MAGWDLAGPLSDTDASEPPVHSLGRACCRVRRMVVAKVHWGQSTRPSWSLIHRGQFHGSSRPASAPVWSSRLSR